MKARSATLAKGLEILSFVGGQKRSVSLRDVMTGLGMTKPTAHRLLATLVDHGMIRYEPAEATYRLGMHLFELSRQVWQDVDLRASAMAEMQKLHAMTGETVSLAILTPDGGVYIDELQSSHHLREQSRVGQRVSKWQSAMGKALTSGLSHEERDKLQREDEAEILRGGRYRELPELSRHLDLVNARGYAIEVDEDVPGISGVAAPIVDHRGITVAAIGLSGATDRLDREALHRLGPDVIEATRLASLRAGGAPRPVSSAPRPANMALAETTVRADVGNLIGEGPVLGLDSKHLYWVDICRPCIFRHNLVSGTTENFFQQEMITSVAATAEGLLVAGLSGIRVIDLETGMVMRDLGDPEAHIPTNRFNDGKCDRLGRFWVGTLAFNLAPGAGSLYRVDPDGKAVQAETGLTLPNGLGWSPDGTVMYLIETADRVVYAYDFNEETGQIANRRNLITFPADMPGSPDGLDVDAAGNLWVAVWDGWCIQQYTPEGQLTAVLGMPFPRPTSCIYLNGNNPRLMLTSARIRVASELLRHYPSSGHLVEMRLR
ncbi:MAG: SMP-30/gluconolactonase/LRE family protein [Geminicoccaceae bacterium]